MLQLVVEMLEVLDDAALVGVISKSARGDSVIVFCQWTALFWVDMLADEASTLACDADGGEDALGGFPCAEAV